MNSIGMIMYCLLIIGITLIVVANLFLTLNNIIKKDKRVAWGAGIFTFTSILILGFAIIRPPNLLAWFMPITFFICGIIQIYCVSRILFKIYK